MAYGMIIIGNTRRIVYRDGEDQGGVGGVGGVSSTIFYGNPHLTAFHGREQNHRSQ